MPRPISAGGTGANNARDAMIALGGELANQGNVSNYDVFPFKSGSFYSSPGATSTPEGDSPSASWFAGICYAPASGLMDNDFYLEARSIATNVKYFRRKANGIWQSWVRDDQLALDNSNLKVAKAGDTMTGQLRVNSDIISSGAVAVGGDILAFGNILRFDPATVTVAYDVPSSRLIVAGAQLQVNTDIISSGAVAAGGDILVTGNILRFNPTTVTVAYDVPSGRLIVAGAQLQVNTDIISTGAVAAGGDILATGNTIKFSPSTVNLTYSAGTGKLVVAGAQFQVNSDLGVGGNINLINNLSLGSGVTTGLLGDGGNVALRTYFGGGIYFQGPSGVETFGIWNSTHLYVASTTASSSPTTGALVVEGGLGVGGNINCAGVINSWAPAGGDAVYNLLDDTGAFRGGLSWLRSTNDVRVTNGTAGTSIVIDADGKVILGRGMAGRAGTTGAYDVNVHNFYWTGTAGQMWIDNANFGNIQTVCDYRTKKDITPLDSTWNAIKALRPIVYTQREYIPPGAERPLLVADDTWQWGFLAHELQETLLPSAAHGYKDSPTDIQSPNLLAIVAALTRALQEAMERIEALEGRA